MELGRMKEVYLALKQCSDPLTAINEYYQNGIINEDEAEWFILQFDKKTK